MKKLVYSYSIYIHLKGHWTSLTSSPNFLQKSCDFYIIRSVGTVNDPMLSFTFWTEPLLEKYEYFQHFLYFKVDFNKYTVQQPMGHSEDDAVHKIPDKMKTYWQKQLKHSALLQFKIHHKLETKIQILSHFVQCPANGTILWKGQRSIDVVCFS